MCLQASQRRAAVAGPRRATPGPDRLPMHLRPCAYRTRWHRDADTRATRRRDPRTYERGDLLSVRRGDLAEDDAGTRAAALFTRGASSPSACPSVRLSERDARARGTAARIPRDRGTRGAHPRIDLPSTTIHSTAGNTSLHADSRVFILLFFFFISFKVKIDSVLQPEDGRSGWLEMFRLRPLADDTENGVL